MYVAYLTTDEVNRDLALNLAEAFGMTLEPLTPRDRPPDGLVDVVLYDVDFLPPAHRREVLAALAAGASPGAAAVHSYSLSKSQARALRRQQVAVSKHLDARLFRKLRRVILRLGEAAGRLVVAENSGE
jgi:hypothetical protein